MEEAGGHPLTPNSLGPGCPLSSTQRLGSHVPGQVLAEPGTLSLPRLFLKLNFLKTGWLIRKRMGLVSGWEELHVACHAWPGRWEHRAGPRGPPAHPPGAATTLCRCTKPSRARGCWNSGGAHGHQAAVGHTDPHPDPRPAWSLATAPAGVGPGHPRWEGASLPCQSVDWAGVVWLSWGPRV